MSKTFYHNRSLNSAVVTAGVLSYYKRSHRKRHLESNMFESSSRPSFIKSSSFVSKYLLEEEG